MHCFHRLALPANAVCTALLQYSLFHLYKTTWTFLGFFCVQHVAPRTWPRPDAAIGSL